MSVESAPTHTTQTVRQLKPGTRVAFKDPDAGQHADGCPFETEIWYIGEIKDIHYNREDNTAYVHFVGGPGPVPADSSKLYFGASIPNSITRAFENSDYETYMWETRHNPNHHLHDELGDTCDWGDNETVRTHGE